MPSVSHSQDLLVAIVAIVLGIGALGAAFSGGRLVHWSGIAQGLEQMGGKRAVVIVYVVLGLFMIGVGISLLL